MTADGWGSRPLTFITRDHLELAAETAWGCIIAERDACGRYITYRAVGFWDYPAGALIVLSGEEARDHLECDPSPCPEVVSLTRQRAVDSVP